MSAEASKDGTGRLDVGALLEGKEILVVGGTGFLGKTWLSMLLTRYPQIGHVWLMVRPRKAQDSEARFWADVAPAGVFEPLRVRYPGAAYEAFLKEKVTAIPGDVSQEFAGVSEDIRKKLRGRVTLLVNSAGIVDFNPPLDEALKVNAFGMQSLVALAKDLGDIGFLHTSTCYVAGDRTGQIDEVHPYEFPFPRAGELDPKHWSADQEIAECVDLVENVRHRSRDSFRESRFLADAKTNLKERDEPTRGSALQDELAKVRRRYESDRLIEAGLERAEFWGWHNVYTYTKSIGEQVLCGSGLPFTIVRPAVIESSLAFPFPGWNEGINTSAPLIYMGMEGLLAYPSHPDAVLDVIPVDLVCAGMMLAMAELIEGTAKPVYQLGSSDSNPFYTYRFIELVSLYKRRFFKDKSTGSPFGNWVQMHYGPTPISPERYYKWGPRWMAETAFGVSEVLDDVGAEVLALKPLLEPSSRILKGFGKANEKTAFIMDQFVPFMATHNYRFSAANTRAAFARLDDADKAKLVWNPEEIDWRHWTMEVHVPGIERHVIPLIEEKLDRPAKALRSHDDLLSFLDEIAERYEHSPALMQVQSDGLSRMSFGALRERARAAAVRLQAAGLSEGDRVLLSALNHPDWVVCWFGVLLAGGVVVPVETTLTEGQAANIAAAASIWGGILDAEARDAFGDVVLGQVLDLHVAAAPGPTDDLPDRTATTQDVASILFTSGTTGVPKGVMLTHGNLTSLIASLGTLFELKEDDRMLSVLPLHHTFEFTCGLLLPLSRGVRILYLDELTGDSLTRGLKEGRITGMVGVPALWQLLERRILGQVKDKGPGFQLAFDMGTALNRMLGKKTGLDVGKILFGSVHGRLGGNIRFLISGGAALPRDTQELFQGLGLHLSEGYGLTEAAPVLTVAQAHPGSQMGHVGKPVPGVTLEVRNPDEHGVGEVVAKGPNVMKGYYGNAEATDAVIDADGWLLTGDLGRIDHKGRLCIVGRAKDVVVTSSGENIYLDDVETELGSVEYVEEYSLVGIEDPRGGERLGLLAVPGTEEDLDRHTVHARARESLKSAIAKLPVTFRPAVVHMVDADLPRTATRKVKRNDVKKILERIASANQPVAGVRAGSGPVRGAIAKVAGVDLSKVQEGTGMQADLGFDSLMWVELSAALDGVTEGQPSVEDLGACETVADVEAVVAAPRPQIEVEEDVRETVKIPAPLVQPLRTVLRTSQRELYGKLLRTQVTGRAFIPQNRPTIVVSNHCSHLDMGLVKYALGPYGKKLVALAAKDYFFEGNKWVVAYFEQLTNLQPVDRSGSFRKSFEEARAVIDGGNVVLLFPEGTRRLDGTLGTFKPLVGKLALETGVDVLPIFLDGTFEVLPKGAIVPRSRAVTVRIGAPVLSSELHRLTEGMRAADSAREASRLLRLAVATLREGSVLDVSALEVQDGPVEEDHDDGVQALFEEFEGRFQPEAVDKPLSWYFSLEGQNGGADAGKWTVSVEKDGCEVWRGRPKGGRADCVVKTTPDMLMRIVREAYVPSVPEFVSGKIKTNEIPLLMELSKVFNFGPSDEVRRS